MMASATKTMTAEHKEALARGRVSARAVRNYLDALETNKPKRGRRRTPDSIRERLGRIETEQADASSLVRLRLAQERLDLSDELERLENDADVDLSELEALFVAEAGSYARSKGISYAVWREFGVEPRVLKAAGINRGS
jgi:hypothetical protein